MLQQSKQAQPMSSGGESFSFPMEIMKEYSLPEAYQSLMNESWRMLGWSVYQQYGQESEAWERMAWFTRILCTSIVKSLEQGRADLVEDALNGFRVWFDSPENGQNSNVSTRANFTSNKILAQVVKDTGDSRLEPTVSIARKDIGDFVEEVVASPSGNNASANERLKENGIDVPSFGHAPEELNVPLENDEETCIMDNLKQTTVASAQPNQAESPLAPAAQGQSLPEPTAVGSIAPVPMGTWFAFHDRGKTTLAMLTIVDLKQGRYMFASKQGLLVTELTRDELMVLKKNNKVEIVEFHSLPEGW